MQSKGLNYTVKKGEYVSNWLTSDVIEIPFVAGIDVYKRQGYG